MLLRLLLALSWAFAGVRSTTIVGLCCKDGVVLGADTRSTGGATVMDKNKHKVHHIASNIYCCGAGTSADCDHLTRSVKHKLELMRIDNELVGDLSDDGNGYMHNSVPIALKLLTTSIRNPRSKLYGSKDGRDSNDDNENGFQATSDNDGMPQSVFILGGCDNNGPSLYQIDMDGYHHKVPYTALGSGSTDAISILETVMFKAGSKSSSSSSCDLSVDDEAAIDAVRRAIRAGITNDLGSGSHVDICAITARGSRMWREQGADDRSYAADSEAVAEVGCGGSGSRDVSGMRRLAVPKGDVDVEFLGDHIGDM